MENRVRVTILGKEYTINGDAPKEYIMELADYLNKKMEEICTGCSTSDPAHLAILAALNVADEYFQLKELKSGMDSEVQKRTMALISMLDEGLIGDIFSSVGGSH